MSSNSTTYNAKTHITMAQNEFGFIPGTADDIKSASSQTFNGFERSPWKDGTTFQITGWTTTRLTKNGQIDLTRPPFLVFETVLGNLFPTMLYKRIVDKDGAIHQNGGSLKTLLDDLSSKYKGQTNEAFFSAVVESVKGKTISVKRKGIIISRKGIDIPHMLIEMDII